MSSIDIRVRRFSVVSSRPFDETVKRLTATISRPDMSKFHGAIAATRTASELEDVVHRTVGSSDLMEFDRFDAGAVLRKEQGGVGPKTLRLVVGNPLLVKELISFVPDAASYIPATILVDERPDGVHLSYDSFASVLAPYGNAAAIAIAKGIDRKIENLLKMAA